LVPGDAAGRSNRATICAKLGRWDAAVADLSRAVELAPKNKGYWSALAAAQYHAGDYKASLAALEKAMELDKGGDAGDWLYSAMARWQLGDKEKAREWYDRAAGRIDKDPAASAELKALLAEAARLMAKPK
jgi:tetratricopeptide (TPR) repeat protein